MDKDFEIEVQDRTEGEAASMQLPVNFLAFGEIENDDVKVYIKQNVYKALEKLAESNTEKELGSIILGEYCEELGNTHVVISEYVEAKYTDATAATLTFTHETWDYIHSEHEKRYPDKRIVGWQHTHPNYGIFLSNYDLFIQENFFNLPFQIAYVIDPIQNLRGFFQWKNGRIEKLKGYYIYDDVGSPIKIEQTKVKKDVSAPKKSVAGRILLALLFSATVLLSVFSLSLSSKYKTQAEAQAVLLAEIADQQSVLEQQSAEIDEQNRVIEDQAQTITGLQAMFADGVSDDSAAATAADLLALLESDGVVLPDKSELIDALKAFMEDNPESHDIAFRAYTVVAGDNLTKICAENDLDYGANARIILAINGIVDADQIYIGQTILLPVMD